MTSIENAFPEALQRSCNAVAKGLQEGLQPGGQVYISRNGEVIADTAFGQAREGVPMRNDSLVLWLSSGKPITSVAIAQLWEQGKLDLDDFAARYIPEFGQKGKEAVTIRHLLTHTSCFPHFFYESSGGPEEHWKQTLEAIYRLPIPEGWVPGQKAAYHVASSWFVLGEIVQRVDGRQLPDYAREEIFLPLGMNDSYLSLSPEQYRAYGERMALLHKTSEQPSHPQNWDTEQRAAWCVPGGNARGPIRELGYFYEAMLGNGERKGARILREETAQAMVQRHRTGMLDSIFGQVIDWGLGFIINSEANNPGKIPYGFGPHASANTFGHSGSESSIGFCDPEHGLVVTAVFNGMPGPAKHFIRMREFCKAVYEDLGLEI